MDRELAIRNLSDPELDAYIRSRMYDPKAQKTLGEQEVASLLGTSPGPHL